MAKATTNSEFEQVKMDVTCSSSETSAVYHELSSKEGGKVREVCQPFPCKVYDINVLIILLFDCFVEALVWCPLD
jgi:hypothetical protein